METMFKILIRHGTKFLLSNKEVPSDDILKSLYKMRTRDSDQHRTVLALYERQIEQHFSQPNYRKIKTMVTKCMDQKSRARII